MVEKMQGCRPKVKYFVEKYPFKLLNNEWIYKFPIGFTKTGKIKTYNPDYFCPDTGYFIEVATSSSNISTQGDIWKKSINEGLKLKIYWWEGREITRKILKRI